MCWGEDQSEGDQVSHGTQTAFYTDEYTDELCRRTEPHQEYKMKFQLGTKPAADTVYLPRKFIESRPSPTIKVLNDMA
jgi:hypothetical protein